MKRVNVINISRFCADDGPGIRTTVFLKGCPLSCLWCHNPESQCPRPEIVYQAEKCRHCGACTITCPQKAHTLSEGAQHRLNRSLCVTCGKCANICPAGAVELSGKPMSADEVFAALARDKVFYDTSGGGITVSGGEPLSHPSFTAEILRKCRDANIHTAIETSGFASKNVLLKVAEFCDLVLFDIKETDPERHLKFTGVPLEPIQENLRTLSELGIPIYIRLPIIPGLNDRAEHLEAVRDIVKTLKSCVGVEIMPYHVLGAYKYGALGREYECADIEEPNKETIAKWRKIVGDTTHK